MFLAIASAWPRSSAPVRLAVALGVHHPVVARVTIPGFLAHFLTDHGDRFLLEAPEATNHRRIVAERPIPMDFVKIGNQGVDKVEGARPIRVAGELITIPGARFLVVLLVLFFF